MLMAVAYGVAAKRDLTVTPPPGVTHGPAATHEPCVGENSLDDPTLGATGTHIDDYVLGP